MKHCAFLTLDERGDFVIDDECAIEPLDRLGWRVETLSWRQTVVPWTRFDAVVIRSTWDYWNDVPAFLDTLHRIDREAPLANPLDLVHWNLAKSYLRDLEGRGVAVVPTAWPDAFASPAVVTWARDLGSPELVVKPVVGANGEDAYRLSIGDPAERLAFLEDRFRGRSCMVQPFLSAVQSEGEYSLFFFGGEYSHAIRKLPAPDEFRSQEERGAAISRVQPAADLLASARRAVGAVRPAPLYARVDLVRDGAGTFRVMELELIEPSLYLRTDPEAPERFARAVDRWFGAG